MCWSGLMLSSLNVLATVARTFLINSLLIHVQTSGYCNCSPWFTSLRSGEKTRIFHISSNWIPVVVLKKFQSFSFHSNFFITLVDYSTNTFSRNWIVFPVFSPNQPVLLSNAVYQNSSNQTGYHFQTSFL